MQIGTEYGEGYFEREEGSAYKNYTWKPDLIGLRLQAIIQTTGISPPDKVLDFGCAKGYYVKWLKQNGFDALGLDISTYAISQAPQDVRRYLRLRYKGDLDDFVDDQFDLTIAKDVLEHLTDYELEETINGLISISKKILVTVPITNSNGNYR